MSSATISAPRKESRFPFSTSVLMKPTLPLVLCCPMLSPARHSWFDRRKVPASIPVQSAKISTGPEGVWSINVRVHIKKSSGETCKPQSGRHGHCFCSLCTMCPLVRQNGKGDFLSIEHDLSCNLDKKCACGARDFIGPRSVKCHRPCPAYFLVPHTWHKIGGHLFI